MDKRDLYDSILNYKDYRDGDIDRLKTELAAEKEKQKELQEIIFRLTEGAYELFGGSIDLNKYRAIVDSVIASDNYKEYLSQKYILKTTYSNSFTGSFGQNEEDLQIDRTEEQLNGVDEMNIKGIN